MLGIHESTLYDLMVARIGPDYGAVGEQALALYELLTGSMRFFPSQPGAPLVAGPECPAPVAGTTLYAGGEGGYCFLLPEAYTAAPGDGGETAFHVGSPLDASHARLFVRVEDAGNRSLEEVTADREAEIAAALPGLDLMTSFGIMADGVPANQFDQVPGQDLSRQVLLVHDGRLFTLTFLPDDPAAGAAYEEMEALYERVLDTLSFMMP